MLGRAATNFIQDSGTQMAASISYYALFSMFPLTLLAVSIFGIVLRNPAVQEQVLNAIITFLPIQDESIANSLRSVAALGPTLTAVSAVGTIWSAGALSAALRSALNRAFDVQVARPWLRAKMMDFLLLPIIGIPFAGGLFLTAAWRVLQGEVVRALGFVDHPFFTSFVWNVGALAIPPVLSFIAFTLTFWLLPNRSLLFRHIWPGGLLAALGFEGLKSGFAFYLEHFASFDVIYGSLGSVIVLLFWIYLVANLVIFSGEVAAEVPHVLRGEPRHGHAPATGERESDWRLSTITLLRGLVFAGDESLPEQSGPTDPRRDR